jgi:hypothetical protein
VVAASAEQLRDDAIRFFRESVPPESLQWVEHLSPVHQRLFAVEIADAIKEIALTSDLSGLVATLEDWEATADLDSSPEAQAELSREKSYRPLIDFTT